jgi:putative membrane protein
MLIAGLVLAGLAGALHVYIFVLESLRWTQPATRRIFGVPSAADAETMRALAFNQGFYNLFLAVAAFLGVVLVAAGARTPGVTLALAGTGMMLAAALVLVLSDRTKTRAAAMQGVLPLLAVIALSLSIG